jgi:hypothetical protein
VCTTDSMSANACTSAAAAVAAAHCARGEREILPLPVFATGFNPRFKLGIKQNLSAPLL